MDLTAAISGLQSAKVASKVQFGVARKVLDAQRAEGISSLKLIEAARLGGRPGANETQGAGIQGAGTPSAGDALVAQATGLGSSIDTYA